MQGAERWGGAQPAVTAGGDGAQAPTLTPPRCTPRYGATGSQSRGGWSPSSCCRAPSHRSWRISQLTRFWCGLPAPPAPPAACRLCLLHEQPLYNAGTGMMRSLHQADGNCGPSRPSPRPTWPITPHPLHPAGPGGAGAGPRGAVPPTRARPHALPPGPGPGVRGRCVCSRRAPPLSSAVVRPPYRSCKAQGMHAQVLASSGTSRHLLVLYHHCTPRLAPSHALAGGSLSKLLEGKAHRAIKRQELCMSEDMACFCFRVSEVGRWFSAGGWRGGGWRGVFWCCSRPFCSVGWPWDANYRQLPSCIVAITLPIALPMSHEVLLPPPPCSN